MSSVYLQNHTLERATCFPAIAPSQRCTYTCVAGQLSTITLFWCCFQLFLLLRKLEATLLKNTTIYLQDAAVNGTAAYTVPADTKAMEEQF